MPRAQLVRLEELRVTLRLTAEEAARIVASGQVTGHLRAGAWLVDAAEFCRIARLVHGVRVGPPDEVGLPSRGAVEVPEIVYSHRQSPA